MWYKIPRCAAHCLFILLCPIPWNPVLSSSTSSPFLFLTLDPAPRILLKSFWAPAAFHFNHVNLSNLSPCLTVYLTLDTWPHTIWHLVLFLASIFLRILWLLSYHINLAFSPIQLSFLLVAPLCGLLLSYSPRLCFWPSTLLPVYSCSFSRSFIGRLSPWFPISVRTVFPSAWRTNSCSLNSKCIKKNLMSFSQTSTPFYQISVCSEILLLVFKSRHLESFLP